MFSPNISPLILLRVSSAGYILPAAYARAEGIPKKARRGIFHVPGGSLAAARFHLYRTAAINSPIMRALPKPGTRAPTAGGGRGPFGAIFSARRQKMTPRCGHARLPPRSTRPAGRPCRAHYSQSFFLNQPGMDKATAPGQRRHSDTSDAPLHLGHVSKVGAVHTGDKHDHN